MTAWPGNFPAFLWGAATSSHQVEGHLSNDWTRWENQGHAKDVSGKAADHWRLWRQDFELLPQLGLNSYRFSLEWSRIEPMPGEFDRAALSQYRTMILRLRELGITPLVTLHHFTLPLWMAEKGGFLNPEAAHWYARYVSRVMEDIGDLVDLYVTINEPMVLVVMGYLIALWPPGGHGFARALKLINRLAHAHRMAYRVIKAVRPDAWAGVAHHVIAFEPWRPTAADRATTRILHFLMNTRFIDMVEDSQDFVGINYYTRQYGHWSSGLHPIQSRPGELLSDLGWEIYPQGLVHLLDQLPVKNKPVLITENGIATGKDATRSQFLRVHLGAVAKAQSRGVDVRGYFHWSLMDNFEWAEGFDPRFGLVEVDYNTGARRIRPSGYYYRKLIQANQGRFPITVPSD